MSESTYHKIISAGHICLDITPVFPASKSSANVGDVLVPGKLINVDAADVHTGGSVANTGLALKILGADVELMGKIGTDPFGGMVKDIAKGYGVSGLIEDQDSSTSYSVVLAVPGVDRIFLHNPGANDTFRNSDIKDESLNDAALFHFGYPPLMRSMFVEDGVELINMLKRMKDKGIATSLDFAAIDPDAESGKADWKKILSGALKYVDFFVPSFEELCFMLNRPLYDSLALKGGDMACLIDFEKDVKPMADELIELGAGVVLIKCGTKGMYYKTSGKKRLSAVGSRLALDVDMWADKEGIVKCYKADKVLSGTGAGDTSIAAFLMALMDKKSPEWCVKLAAAEGACAVTTYDALGGLKPLKELEERINNGWEILED
ncbi:MAG: carbohydrate kinase family protein [Saccharofermentans sp.]|nr:carbohydrate kinase family protein [Saccharofermentans sp.]